MPSQLEMLERWTKVCKAAMPVRDSGTNGPVDDSWLIPHHTHKVCAGNGYCLKSASSNSTYLDSNCSNALVFSE